jgi:hypothetical protein
MNNIETVQIKNLEDFLDWYKIMSKEYQMSLDKPCEYPCVIAFIPEGCDLIYTFIYNKDLQ